MNDEIKKTFGEIKGAPVPAAICMEPKEIKGIKPHVKLDEGRSVGQDNINPHL